MNNTIAGFSKLSKEEKINWIANNYFSTPSEAIDLLKKYWNSDSILQQLHDEFIENTITNFYIPLGVAMQLPQGFEAIIDSRSSGPKKLGLFIPNGQGVVDNTYNGNDDQWHYVCSPMRETTIEAGDRICQFRIQLSQKATMWQKIKWLLSSGIELVEVDDLGNENRLGFGSTGIK